MMVEIERKSTKGGGRRGREEECVLLAR